MRVELRFVTSEHGVLCAVTFGTYQMLESPVVASDTVTFVSRSTYNSSVIFICFSVANSFNNAHFGPGTGPIVLDDLRCTGNETNLHECPFDPSTTDCNHARDAGVRCYPINGTAGETTEILKSH